MEVALGRRASYDKTQAFVDEPDGRDVVTKEAATSYVAWAERQQHSLDRKGIYFCMFVRRLSHFAKDKKIIYYGRKKTEFRSKLMFEMSELV